MTSVPIVLIDDERSFIDDHVEPLVLRNSVDALQWLASIGNDTAIGQLWLDHDLGMVKGEKITIMPFVRELERRIFEETAPQIEQVLVHTSNSVGGLEIVASLNRYYRTVRVSAGDYLIAR